MFQDFAPFAIMVILISASGVMSPGPLFMTSLVYGLKDSWKSGVKIAFGHAIVELPLIILLGMGVFSLDIFPQFRILIGITGGIALFGFSLLQIRETLRKHENTKLTPKHRPLIAGILFSALNPFFIIWWLTIGFKLISDAISIWSFEGIFILFAMHIWMDFVWLALIGFISSKSTKILSSRNYKIIIILLSITLVYFGILFLVDGLTAV